MRLIHPLHRSELPEFLIRLEKQPVLFSLPNGRKWADFSRTQKTFSDLLFANQPEEKKDRKDFLDQQTLSEEQTLYERQILFEIDSENPDLKVEWIEEKGIPFAMVQGKPQKKDFRLVPDENRRVHILMNTSIIDDPWCFSAIKPYLHQGDEVCVLAFSFFDDTKNARDWDLQYKKPTGCWYKANTDVFARFGIPEKDVHWVNYFTDAREKMLETIARSNVLLLTGGAPDLMMKRIKEKKLMPLLKAFHGVIIGYSAGAMVQLGDYHIAPDQDYPEFSWQKGMGWLNDFDIEVHYHATPHQKRWLDYVQEHNSRPVYCLYEEGGLIAENGKISCFGQVDFLEGKAGSRKEPASQSAKKKKNRKTRNKNSK